MKRSRCTINLALILFTLMVSVSAAQAQTAFPYRGKLSTVTGTYDFRFTLYNAASGGTIVGTPLLRTGVAVTSGNYAVMLDFGSNSFAAALLYIQVAYRKSGTATFANTGSRLLLTVQFSVVSGSAMGLQGRPVSPDAPAAGQVLKFDGAQWTPGADEGGGGGGLTLPFAGSVATAETVFAITNTGTGVGVYGYSGGNPGVWGESPSSWGVYGKSSSNSGVRGQSESWIGVEGTSGSSVGVYGISSSYYGVFGLSASGIGGGFHSTSGYGVVSDSDSWVGVRGIGGNTGVWGSGGGWGLYGDSASGSGVQGTSTNGYGVYGVSANNFGVIGQSTSSNGVYASSTNAEGVFGTSTNKYGVAGHSANDAGVAGFSGNWHGVLGLTSSTADGIAGVYGINYGSFGRAMIAQAPSGFGLIADGGLYGVLGNSPFVGVFGHLTSASGLTGVFGNSLVNGTRGVYGHTNGEYSVGVYGRATGLHSMGVYGLNDSSNPTASDSWAGYFQGDLGATRKFFRIDHPQDPANKYLLHSCVESPDMKNIYDGNVTTDANGDAAVLLPDYFESLNRDFRYQLTVLGQFAQAVVAHKIEGNRFTLKTDKPFVEVSWQVTGIRRDAYARAHPMAVEQIKPDNERGLYLHPKEHGVSETLGIGYEQRRKEEEALRRIEQRSKAASAPHR